MILSFVIKELYLLSVSVSDDNDDGNSGSILIVVVDLIE